MRTSPTTDRFEALRASQQFAYDRAPAIRAVYELATMTPQDLQGPADLARLAVTSKDSLLDKQRQSPPFEEFLAADDARRVNALLLTCGAYDAAGDFAYRIGLPVKTGVGGGIVAIAPGMGTIAVWAPELDAKGNSVLGAFALERLVQLTGWHFASA